MRCIDSYFELLSLIFLMIYVLVCDKDLNFCCLRKLKYCIKLSHTYPVILFQLNFY